jgi:Flp pilus assembly protein TadG
MMKHMAKAWLNSPSPPGAFRNWRRSAGGQGVVEFAIVLPILLLLILGLINLGVVVNTQIVITQAAWEGARAGATLDRDAGENDAQIFGAVNAALKPLDAAQASIEIEPQENQAPRNLPWPEPRGKPLTVRVEYELRLSLPFPAVLKLRSQATSRMEYQNPP